MLFAIAVVDGHPHERLYRNAFGQASSLKPSSPASGSDAIDAPSGYASADREQWGARRGGYPLELARIGASRFDHGFASVGPDGFPGQCHAVVLLVGEHLGAVGFASSEHGPARLVQRVVEGERAPCRPDAGSSGQQVLELLQGGAVQVGTSVVSVRQSGGLDLDIRRRCHNMLVLYWYTAISLPWRVGFSRQHTLGRRRRNRIPPGRGSTDRGKASS